MNVMCECKGKGKGRASTTTLLLQPLREPTVVILLYHLFYAQSCVSPPRISITHTLTLVLTQHVQTQAYLKAIPVPASPPAVCPQGPHKQATQATPSSFSVFCIRCPHHKSSKQCLPKPKLPSVTVTFTSSSLLHLAHPVAPSITAILKI